MMLFGNLISVGIAPSPSVAFASDLVIPVTLLDSDMLYGYDVDVGEDGEGRMKGR